MGVRPVPVPQCLCPRARVGPCSPLQVAVRAEVPGPLVRAHHELPEPRAAGEALQVGVQPDRLRAPEVSARRPLAPSHLPRGYPCSPRG